MKAIEATDIKICADLKRTGSSVSLECTIMPVKAGNSRDVARAKLFLKLGWSGVSAVGIGWRRVSAEQTFELTNVETV